MKRAAFALVLILASATAADAHSHAQCLRSAPHLAALAAAVDAERAACEAAKAELRVQHEAAIADLQAQMEAQGEVFNAEREKLAADAAAARQEAETAIAELVGVQTELAKVQAALAVAQEEAVAARAEAVAASNLLTAWKAPRQEPPVEIPTQVSNMHGVEVTAPAGINRVWWGVGIRTDLGAGPYIGRWSVHPVVDGKVKIEFAGAKPGPVAGVLRWEFPDQAPVDQAVTALVADPLRTWDNPVVDTGSVNQKVELGDLRRADQDVRIVGVAAYRAFKDRAAPTVGRIWAGGQKIAEVPLECPEVGWCAGYFPGHTVTIAKGTEFIVSYDAPAGWAGDFDFFGTATAPTTHARNGMTVLSGIYAYTTTSTYPLPSVKFRTNYFADALTVPVQ